MAAARPASKLVQCSVYNRVAITSVLYWPPVITYTMSKILSTLMIMVVITTVIVGRIIGTMMPAKISISVAPSTRAASRISDGTPFSAAARMVMEKPVHIQMPTTIIASVLITGCVTYDTG